MTDPAYISILELLPTGKASSDLDSVRSAVLAMVERIERHNLYWLDDFDRIAKAGAAENGLAIMALANHLKMFRELDLPRNVRDGDADYYGHCWDDPLSAPLAFLRGHFLRDQAQEIPATSSESRRPAQYKAILKAIETLRFNAQSIPMKGKGAIREKVVYSACTPAAFDKVWQEGVTKGLWRMADHDKYAPPKKK